MASTDAYGSMFHTLANRFKQHDHESNARASAQADLHISKSRSAPSSSNYNLGRRPSYVPTDNHSAHVCPHCRLVRRASTVSSTSSTAHSPVTRHLNDDCFGNFCPDIVTPARFNPHDPARYHHHRRSSLLADKDRDSSDDSSASSHDSPAHIDSRASVEADRRKCRCGSIKPTENLEERYGREPPR